MSFLQPLQQFRQIGQRGQFVAAGADLGDELLVLGEQDRRIVDVGKPPCECRSTVSNRIDCLYELVRKEYLEP
ncbi:MAG TPA: hypothetical protein VFE62_22385 [Gemmataceae bacterium]|nr:hypothetical protein [Gemmataceae bacterium]